MEKQLPQFEEHELEWDDRKVSNLWNYYSRTPPYCNVYFAKIFGKYILKKTDLPLNQNLTILDFGCGPGYLWDHLCYLKAHWNYTGIDFSKNSIKILNKKGNGHTQFKTANLIQSFPVNICDASFDIVLLVEVCEHLNDKYLKDVLLETYRLLKPGGMVVISVPNKEELELLKRFCPECGAIFHQWQHVRSWNSESITEYLRHYEFSLSKIKTLDLGAQGLTFKAVLRKAQVLIKKYILGRNYTAPHLLAVFQKDSKLFNQEVL